MKAKNSGLKDYTQQAEQLAQSMGYVLVDIGIEKETTGNYLRAYLDKAGGIGFEDCEAYHRKLQPLVEHVDYDYLEVSSPGIDRPIKNERDAQRAHGHLVEIRLYRPLNGEKHYQGEFVKLDADGYHLLVNGQTVVFAAKSVALAKPLIDVEAQLLNAAEQGEEKEE